MFAPHLEQNRAMSTRMRRIVRTAFASAFLCSAPHAVAGQQIVSSLLPDTAAERLVEFHNMETTTRLSGDARIGPGTVIRGGLAVLAGSLTVEGRVEGDVVVINGDLLVAAGGGISGRAIVAGGTAVIAETGNVAGAVHVYREPLRYRHQGDAISYVPPDLEEGLSAGRDFAFGRTELRISSSAYNRAEGLPVSVGPRIRFGGTHPITARALLIARTAVPDGEDDRRIGYDLRVEQLVGPDMGLTLGAHVISVIDPIEKWGLTDVESALATFVLHHDYRDHYARRGWGAFIRMSRPGTPYSVQLEYRDENHERTPLADPIVLLRMASNWRPEPSVAEGSLHSIAASLRYDTRNEERDPSVGWLVDAHIEQGVGGKLVNAGALDPVTGTAGERDASTSFLTGRVDVRRYARLSPYARIGLRVIAAGSITGGSLPPQRQHALGGEGSLPGYHTFEFDCGARENRVVVDGDVFHPYYGCDRMAVVQLEYQAGFPFARRVSEALGLGSSLGYQARWVAFFDAGRAWNEPGSRDARVGGNDDFSADAGLGIRLGPLGGYWTIPLSGDGHGFNLFLRLAPRL